MKRLLIALAMLPTVALAQPKQTTEIYVLPNRSGGEIVLTKRACMDGNKAIPELFEAYSWSPSNRTLYGCWVILDGLVHVVYRGSSDVRIYPTEDFKAKKVPK